MKKDYRGTKIFEFVHRTHFFEVFENPNAQDEYIFVGYHNGQQSITATRADICARAMQKKHLHGLPEGELIDFKAAVAKIKEARG